MMQRKIREGAPSKKKTGVLCVAGCCLLLLGTSVYADTLKLASIAPQNSPWGRILERIVGHFNRYTDGEVTVQVFHNSIAGSEADVLRKMRLRQIDIGIFTSLGLSRLAPEVVLLSTPGLYRDENELMHVFDEIKEDFYSTINEGRFRLLGIGIVGWVYPFSISPVQQPRDLTKERLATSDTNSEVIGQYQRIGFNTVTLDYSEWLTGLNSGLVGAFIASPLAAAGFQWFGVADNMVDYPISPFLGGMVINESAWNKIPRANRDRLIRAIQREVQALSEESLALEKEAIATMQQYGLNIIPVPEQNRQQWVSFFTPSDEIVAEYSADSRQFYSKLQGLIAAYRRNN